MKIRRTHESVRFRISPSEFAALQRGESVQELLAGDETSAWRAEIIPQGLTTSIQFGPGLVRVLISAEDRLRLADPEAEGVYFQREEAPALRYYIEKDFPCAHPRAAEANEPQTETFE